MWDCASQWIENHLEKIKTKYMPGATQEETEECVLYYISQGILLHAASRS